MRRILLSTVCLKIVIAISHLVEQYFKILCIRTDRHNQNHSPAHAYACGGTIYYKIHSLTRGSIVKFGADVNRCITWYILTLPKSFSPAGVGSTELCALCNGASYTGTQSHNNTIYGMHIVWKLYSLAPRLIMGGDLRLQKVTACP